MRLSLTDLAIRQLKFAGKQQRIMDTTLPGFGILISKTVKTFIVVKGKERKLTTLGRYPELSLKDARARAVAEMSKDTAPTQKGLLEAYSAFQTHAKARLKPATYAQYVSYLDQMDLKPSLTYEEIKARLAPWNGKPYAQNYAYASIRNLLNFAVEHGYILYSPLTKKKPPNKVRSRDKVLSDEELARVWRCTGNNTYGRILRLLILTGQRREEVRRITAPVDNLITFKTKGDKVNVLPVTPLVLEELKHLPFTFNDWSRSKARFDTDCGVDFRHHDLRRTLATKLAMLGVDVVVIERILGHAIPGVAGIYNRWSYLPQVKEALLTWEAYILKITAPGHVTRAVDGSSQESPNEDPQQARAAS